MAPKIKLTYFNVRGRAEIARLILAQAGVEYEDHRIPREDWPKIKPSKYLSLIFKVFVQKLIENFNSDAQWSSSSFGI